MGRVIVGTKLDTYPGSDILLPDDTQRATRVIPYNGTTGRAVAIGGWVGVPSAAVQMTWALYDSDGTAPTNRQAVSIADLVTNVWSASGPGGANIERPLSSPVLLESGDSIHIANLTDAPIRTASVVQSGAGWRSAANATLTFADPFGSSTVQGSNLILPWYVIVEENRSPIISDMHPSGGVPIVDATPELTFTVSDADRTEGYNDWPTSAIIRMYEKIEGSYRFYGSQVATLSEPAAGTEPVQVTIPWGGSWHAKLRAWWDAAAITGIANGSPLTVWPDVSGAGLDAVQTTPTNQPVYRTNRQNGLPGVEFDGVNDFLTTALTASSNDETLLVVAKLDVLPTSPNTRGFIGTAQTGGRGAWVDSLGQLILFKRWVGSLGLVTGVSAASTFLATTLVNPSTARISVNQNSTGTIAHSLPMDAGATTRIGDPDGGSSTWDGDIYEIIACSTLTDAERQSAEGYLAQKWGLTANLPSNHPYKTNPIGVRLPLGELPITRLWTPDDLAPAGMGSGDTKAWWKADAITGVANGAGLATWNDSSGGGWNATQGTGANQPIYRTNQINALPAVDFDGTNDFLVSSLSASQLGENYFAVLKRDTSAIVHAVLGSSGSGGRTILLNAVNPWPIRLHKESVADIGVSTSTGSNGTVHMVEGQIGGIAWEAGRDGTVQNGSHAQTLTAARTTRIGAISTAGNAFDGLIGEIVVTTELLPYERWLVEGYLAWKWGIQAQLPADHAYKTAAPTVVIGYTDPKIYAWTAEVRDEVGGITGTGYGGRDLETDAPDGTTEFAMNDIGQATTISPTGRHTTRTPSPWSFDYQHASNGELRQVQIRILKRNESGEYSIDQESVVIDSSVAANTIVSIEWKDLNLSPLDWNTDYAIQWRLIDENGRDSGWNEKTYFTTNKTPLQGIINSPKNGTAITGLPLLTFDITDSDDAGGSWFGDPDLLEWQAETVGPGSGNGQMNTPGQIALSGTRVYVADNGNGRFQRFDTALSWVSSLSLALMAGIDVDITNNVYVAYGSNFAKYNASHVLQTSGAGAAGSAYRHVVTDGSRLWLVNSGLGRIEERTTATPTVLVATLGIKGNEEGKFVSPYGITFGMNLEVVSDVAIWKSRIFVTDTSRKVVLVFDAASRTFEYEFGEEGQEDGQFLFPSGITIHPLTGTLWIADPERHDIQEFTQAGEHIQTYRQYGSVAGRWVGPSGIDIVNTGTDTFLYVGDVDRNRALKFLIPPQGDLEPISHLAGEVEISGSYHNDIGTFDADIADWPQVINNTGWTVSYAWSGSGQRSGGGALKGTITAAPANVSTTSSILHATGDNFPVVEGYTYSVKGWFNRSSDEILGSIVLRWMDSNDLVINLDTTPWVGKNAEYRETRGAFTAPPQAVKLAIEPQVIRSSTAAFTGPETFYWDDVSLESGVRYVRAANYEGGDTFSYQFVSDDLSELGAYQIRARGKDLNTKGPWSYPVVINKVIGPAATITTPTSGQVLNTASPLVAWLLTAGAQWRYKVQALVASTGAVAYDSGWIQDAVARSHVIPLGYLADGGQYIAQLWIDDGSLEVLI